MKDSNGAVWHKEVGKYDTHERIAKNIICLQSPSILGHKLS